jgi:hypothetical protein
MTDLHRGSAVLMSDDERANVSDVRHVVGVLAEHALIHNMDLHMKLAPIYHALADIVPMTDTEAY